MEWTVFNMLKHRLITALILIPLVLWALFAMNSVEFAIGTAVIALLATWEWAELMGLQNLIAKLGYVILVGVAMLACYWIAWTKYVFLGATLWWIVAIVLVLIYPQTSHVWAGNRLISGAIGLLVLVPTWLALNVLRGNGDRAVWVLFLFVLVWGVDAIAYFVGRRWGQRKLLPRVSPGKTWAGVYGAIIAAVCVSVIGGNLLLSTPIEIFWLIVISLLMVIISIFGDLFESTLKRFRGVKDSGVLLPGHGGVLDRIDSMTAVAPIFVLLVWSLGLLT